MPQPRPLGDAAGDAGRAGRRARSAADIVLCEGVMGLFDGTGPTARPARPPTLARLTGWPVVLVVDARGQGASVAALVAGFARHDPAVPLAGVDLQPGRRRAPPRPARSARSRAICPACRASARCRRTAALALPRAPSRAGAGRRGADGAAALIGGAAAQSATRSMSTRLVGAGPAVAFAGDRMRRVGAACRRSASVSPSRATTRFSSPTPAVLDGWRRQGAEISFFSPLADEAPDPAPMRSICPAAIPSCTPAGSPRPRDFLRRTARRRGAGAAIYGECGGYMVLGETLTDADGQHPPHGRAAAARDQLRRAPAASRLSRGATAGATGRSGAARRPVSRPRVPLRDASSREGGAEPLFALRDARGTDLGTRGLRRGTVAGSFIHLIDRAGLKPPAGVGGRTGGCARGGSRSADRAAERGSNEPGDARGQPRCRPPSRPCTIVSAPSRSSSSTRSGKRPVGGEFEMLRPQPDRRPRARARRAVRPAAAQSPTATPPASIQPARTRFIAGEPINPATNTVAGRS